MTRTRPGGEAGPRSLTSDGEGHRGAVGIVGPHDGRPQGAQPAPDRQPLPKLVPLGHVAAMLHIHINTAKRWAVQGIIPAYRLGPRGDWRADPEAVLRALEVRAAQARAAQAAARPPELPTQRTLGPITPAVRRAM